MSGTLIGSKMRRVGRGWYIHNLKSVIIVARYIETISGNIHTSWCSELDRRCPSDLTNKCGIIWIGYIDDHKIVRRAGKIDIVPVFYHPHRSVEWYRRTLCETRYMSGIIWIGYIDDLETIAIVTHNIRIVPIDDDLSRSIELSWSMTQWSSRSEFMREICLRIIHRYLIHIRETVVIHEIKSPVECVRTKSSEKPTSDNQKHQYETRKFWKQMEKTIYVYNATIFLWKMGEIGVANAYF